MRTVNVRWSSDSAKALSQCLHYMVDIVEWMELTFNDSLIDPIDTAKQYLKDLIDHEQYRSSADIWWDYLDNSRMLQDFDSRPALVARIALSLLSIGPNQLGELNEYLSWFLLFVHRLGFGLELPYSKLDLLPHHSNDNTL